MPTLAAEGMLQDRLDFLRGPGGLRAAAFFGLKLTTRLEAFRLLWTPAHPGIALALPPDWHYVSLHQTKTLAELPKDCLLQLAQQCGSQPEQLLARGGSLHLLLQGETLVAQLSIDRGPTCQMDSPPLQLAMLPTDAFLGYLYTWPHARRQGAAGHLIKSTVGNLGQLGTNRVLALVRATNVPSLAAFQQADWHPCATLVCLPGGRLLLSPGAKGAGLTLRSPGR